MVKGLAMKLVPWLSVLVASTLAPSLARAAEPAFGDRFFYGSSDGELPDAKLAVIGGLYAGAIASAAVGGVLLFGSLNEADRASEFKQAQEPGFCNEIGSYACMRYRSLLDEEVSLRENGLLLLGVGGLLGLSGALTAELWKNDASARVSFGADEDGGSVTLSGSF